VTNAKLARKPYKNHRYCRPKLHENRRVSCVVQKPRAGHPAKEGWAAGGSHARTCRTAPLLFGCSISPRPRPLCGCGLRLVLSLLRVLPPPLPFLPHPSAKPAFSPGLDATRRSLRLRAQFTPHWRRRRAHERLSAADETAPRHADLAAHRVR
jgi:hypothetical protein